MTVADFLDSYYDRYVVAESLRSAASIRSRLATLKASLGTLPVETRTFFHRACARLQTAATG